MYNVLIRPLVITDAYISWKWRNDPEVWKYTGTKPNQYISYELEKEWIEKVIVDSTSRRFAILVDGEYVGNIQLTNIEESKKAEYHIFIGNKEYWAKGIASLATFQIIKYARTILNLEEIYLIVNPSNIPAIKLYEKCNFTRLNNDIKMSFNLLDKNIPKVSIFMMVYNHEKFIKEALDGVLMQKCNFDYEIVIGEDYSSDESRNIILKCSKQFPGKFKLLLHNSNIGAQKNQLAVLENCNGQFLAMCEGDDYWTDPLKLQRQVDFLEKNDDYNICFHKIRIFNQEENVFKKDAITRDVPETTNIEELAKGNFIHTPSVVIRNNFTLPKWFSKSPIGDWTLYMIAVKDKKIKKFDDVMAVYRVHGDSIWSLKTDEFRISKTIESIKLVLNSSEIKVNVKNILKETMANFKKKLTQNPHVLVQLMKKTKGYLNL